MHFCWELVTEQYVKVVLAAHYIIQELSSLQPFPMSSSTRRCLYIVITPHSAIWHLKAMLLFLREMLFSNYLQCIDTGFHVLSSYLGNKKYYN